jgi:hypothetical protein
MGQRTCVAKGLRGCPRHRGDDAGSRMPSSSSTTHAAQATCASVGDREKDEGDPGLVRVDQLTPRPRRGARRALVGAKRLSPQPHCLRAHAASRRVTRHDALTKSEHEVSRGSRRHAAALVVIGARQLRDMPVDGSRILATASRSRPKRWALRPGSGAIGHPGPEQDLLNGVPY